MEKVRIKERDTYVYGTCGRRNEGTQKRREGEVGGERERGDTEWEEEGEGERVETQKGSEQRREEGRKLQIVKISEEGRPLPRRRSRSIFSKVFPVLNEASF